MERTETVRLIAMMLLIILLPVIVILANVHMIAFSNEFYQEEVARLNSASRYAEAPALAREIASFYTEGKPLPADKLEEREITHLQDVKRILDGATYALYALTALYLALIFALYKTTKKFKTFVSYVKKSLLSGSILLLILLAGLALIFTSFHFFFDKFHYLFFEQGTWNFPEESNLIKTFPEQFFVDAAVGVILNSFIFAAGILALSFLSMKFRSSR